MAASSVLVSLEQLLNPKHFPAHHRNPQIETLHTKICTLQSNLEKIYPVPRDIREDVKKLDSKIRDVIYTAQDTIESYLLKQTNEEEQTPTSTTTFLQELDGIITALNPMAEEVEKLADSMASDPIVKAQIDADKNAKPATRSTRIVGQEKDFERLSTELLKESSTLQVVPIYGLPGIGKTTLARSLFEDEKIQESFSNRAWVTVSQDAHVSEIIAKLLNTMESRGQKGGEKVYEGSFEHLSTTLHQSLYNKKYLVVVDDMWDKDVWDRVKQFLPDNKNGSRILLTTRLKTIVDHATLATAFRHKMEPLDPENSWTLLCEKAFGGPTCPDFLEEVGREISKHCAGLPLSLTVIGGVLFKASRTVEFWDTIEKDTFAAAQKGEDAYLEILSLSYNHLPGKLKGCFLYMGAFPEDSEILVSKLVRLWVAEGIMRPPSPQVESFVKDQVEDLIDRNLIAIRKSTSNNKTKACGMHDSLRDLAVQESEKEQFFHSIRRYKDLPEEAKTQRRLCVHRNILLCMQDVYESAITVKRARSLVCAGAHHHHPLPFPLSFELLKVLDAYTIYFIEFPEEILKMIHLRYLSFTYNGKLPSKLSNMKNLQALLVRRHPKIIFIGASILPDEIWGMSHLRHLLFTESELPDLSVIPETDAILLQHLQSLSNVNAASCTQRVLQNMPDLKKLGMWIEKPGAVGLYLDEVKQLETFKFTVLNPIPKSQVEFSKIFFPETLKKLSLSGCGLPWKDMDIIAATLPNLEVLKLRELAFQGEEWCPDEEVEFPELKFLLIEYLDFQTWAADHLNFPSLERIFLRHCYELEKIHLGIGEMACLKLVELVDCSPPAVEWAEKVKVEEKDKKGFRIRIYSSWE